MASETLPDPPRIETPADRRRARWRRFAFWVSMAAVVLVVIGALCWMPYQEIRHFLHTERIKVVGLAFHNYHDTWKTFPPSATVDENGDRFRSWRTDLLPFIENQGLYDRYRLDEPWDSPHNLAVGRMPVEWYRCSLGEGEPHETTFFAVTGKEAAFEAGVSRKYADFDAAMSNTILFVDLHDRGVGWSEPRDVSALEILYRPDPRPGEWYGTIPWGGAKHRGGMMATFADGSVRIVPDDVDPETLRQMLDRHEAAPYSR